MCGFVGIVAGHGEPPIDATALERALDTLEHRGPDARRLQTGPGYALGHVRLAIVDLSDRAVQPMWDGGDRYALVYNGEVFNYLALKNALAAQGRIFRTTSDSEVVLH